MSRIRFFLHSSVGKKFLMSLSGLFLILFLIIHLLGNFTLFFGRDSFNQYAQLITGTPFIYLAEIALVLSLITHFITSLRLTLENRKARPIPYKLDYGAGARTFASSHMIHSGLIVGIFILIHLINFKFADWQHPSSSSPNIVTLYDLVVLRFQSLYYLIFYLFCMFGLSFHLNHAFQSAFQTLGLKTGSLRTFLNRFGFIFSLIIPMGFSSFPLYFYFLY